MELELESILLPGIEEKRPLVIAGPCSAETEEQVMDTARQLAAKGMKICRARGQGISRKKLSQSSLSCIIYE